MSLYPYLQGLSCAFRLVLVVHCYVHGADLAGTPMLSGLHKEYLVHMLTFCVSIRVTSKYMWPFNEDLTRFDFEVDNDQEESSDGTPKMLEPFASLMMSQTGIEPDSQSGSDVSGHVTEDSASC